MECIRNDCQHHGCSKARTRRDCDGVVSHGSAAFAAECPILNRCSESVSPHTNRNVPTSACKTGIALKSSDEDRRGTLRPCQTYSIHGRSYKTSGRPCAATNRRVGIECEGSDGPRLFSWSVSRSKTTDWSCERAHIPRYYEPVRIHGGAWGLQHSKPVVYLCSIRRNVRLMRG